MMFGESQEERVRVEAYSACASERDRLRALCIARGERADRLWWKPIVEPGGRIGWRLARLTRSLDDRSETLEDDGATLAEVYVTSGSDPIVPGSVLTAHSVDYVARAKRKRLWYLAAGAATAAASAAAALGG